jgi:hypothetical protein
MVPALEPHCKSWIIVSRASGEAIMETFSRAAVEKINRDRFDVYTAAQWLAKLNRDQRARGAAC